MSVRLGGPDRASIRLLRGWPNGLLYAPGSPDITEQKIREHFVDGSSGFRDGDQIERYYVQRCRNYSHIDFLASVPIWHALVEGECHAGHFVNIADAASCLKWFKELTPDEYAVKVFGKNYGFPPYGIGCCCRMEGLIEGTDNYHAQNSARKLWNWMRRNAGK